VKLEQWSVNTTGNTKENAAPSFSSYMVHKVFHSKRFRCNFCVFSDGGDASDFGKIHFVESTCMLFGLLVVYVVLCFGHYTRSIIQIPFHGGCCGGWGGGVAVDLAPASATAFKWRPGSRTKINMLKGEASAATAALL
jgi:hypothetical protein